MVASVKTTCARCGSVELPTESARILVPTAGAVHARMEFVCPRCGGRGSEALNERATMLLMRAGVSVGAVAEPFPSHAGPAHFDDGQQR
jgi:hypothetical protein